MDYLPACQVCPEWQTGCYCFSPGEKNTLKKTLPGYVVQIKPSFLFHLNYKMFLFGLYSFLLGFENELDVIYCAFASYFNLFFSSRTN